MPGPHAPDRRLHRRHARSDDRLRRDGDAVRGRGVGGRAGGLAAVRETHILIVRHPETEANVNGRLVGRGASPYTDEGRDQLRRIPHAVREFGPDEVWTSPLERAYVLGAAAAEHSDCPLKVDDRLVEIDFGLAEGLTFEEIAAQGMRVEYRNADAPVAPEGESRGDVERRAGEVVETLAERSGRFAVVTHGGVFRAMMVRALGLCSPDIWAFHVRNGQLA
ncbi:MAG: histidine phosphatase family protein, partial [Actinobacteria bacterium]